nr:baseplate assembly protein [Novosphingobium sp. P6W]
MIQLGTVASVDHGAATCTVEIGDLMTGDLPWLAWCAGRIKVWAPPSSGEQCTVLSPEGDLAGGLVLPGLWSDANPAPSTDPDIFLIKFDDGAELSYHFTTHALTIALPTGGTIDISAPGGVTITGDVTINGNLSIAGKAEATDDMVGGGISLKNHKHTGVQAGAAQTGAPVS